MQGLPYSLSITVLFQGKKSHQFFFVIKNYNNKIMSIMLSIVIQQLINEYIFLFFLTSRIQLL